ncbi:MAG: arginine--tRNA ligase [Bacteroidia bacterium]|nr:arginine--tRNA ligase [Bacteroidia bacterium]NNF31630.1 arginine--tRNA ligase [Flavobacteriaceae bacterium]NNJ81247.1 arginine--tRNA ligase [Flavobacteriaceae bacterium]NNK54726.1 arginine--tRNA ligase [Flavobacteriaceae bacterium]NNM09963.1 arginine--tRNA ligase [Flavobacteriaceae bacterium]
MVLQEKLTTHIKKATSDIYGVSPESVEFQATRKEFEGDITVVVFPMLKVIKGNPVQIGESIGTYLTEKVDEVSGYNVVKGFLNLVLSDSYFLEFFSNISNFSSYGIESTGTEAMMVEYASPNTNKPLHLGHMRNILLGYSVAEILKAAGKKVYKTQIINDRGIHICKSMLAWKRYGNGETPDSSGIKGDKLVGNYYVKFDKVYKEEIEELKSQGKPEEEAKATAPSLMEAQEMLRKWEAGDPDTVGLWKTMNGWVYDGFDKTYTSMGVDFDSYYYESDTYLLGKDNIEEGLAKGVFYRKEDGSVWCDLTEEGLDEKIVLRSDGTAVYMTQDIGTAIQRVKDHPDINGMIYTVGNEQEYHFKVLFLILKKLGFSWAKNLYHLSYGMVDLPSGKMKSREGTVVDADDLIEEMSKTAKDISEELGKIEEFSEDEKKELYHTIGMGALKYYILKVDPRKGILFNPKESVDFQGNTGPFIQYTYARIQSILRKATSLDEGSFENISLHPKEKELLKQLMIFPETIQAAASNYSPALIANYTYDLVKEFNSFYQNVTILGAESPSEKNFRVQLSNAVAEVIKSAFSMLGINVPERM